MITEGRKKKVGKRYKAEILKVKQETDHNSQLLTVKNKQNTQKENKEDTSEV